MGNWSDFAAWAALALAVFSALGVNQIKSFVGFSTKSRKWSKGINGERYIPKNLPTKYPSDIPQIDRDAIHLFSNVSAHLNITYQDEPWSFEDAGVIGSYELGSGSPYRKIDIRYNQARLGFIKICSFNYNGVLPDEVRVEFNLSNARSFDGFSVYGLALSCSKYVMPLLEHELSIQETILSGMVQATWQIGDEMDVCPTLELTFRGTGQIWREAKWNLD